MSSPITNIVSSRSISSRSASWRAARNKVSGIAVDLPLARVHVAVELVDRRVGAFIREANDLFDLAFDVVPDLLEVAGRSDPASCSWCSKRRTGSLRRHRSFSSSVRYLSGSTTEWPLNR